MLQISKWHTLEVDPYLVIKADFIQEIFGWDGPLNIYFSSESIWSFGKINCWFCKTIQFIRKEAFGCICAFISNSSRITFQGIHLIFILPKMKKKHGKNLSSFWDAKKATWKRWTKDVRSEGKWLPVSYRISGPDRTVPLRNGGTSNHGKEWKEEKLQKLFKAHWTEWTLPI